MTQTVDAQILEPVSAPFAGRRLYSPAVLAAYTALANLPLGIILYGINQSARGNQRFGRTLIAFGTLAFALLMFASFAVELPRLTMLVGIFGAINVYALERRPFDVAMSQGAVRARWWPPALVLIVLVGLSFLAQNLAQ